MNVDEKFVRKISELSYLKLSPPQISHYVEQMNKILSYVETLNSLPETTDRDTEPGNSEAGPERPDVVEPGLSSDLAMREAPDAAGSSFRVPRVVE